MTLLDKIKKIQGSVRWPGAKSIFTYFWSGAPKTPEVTISIDSTVENNSIDMDDDDRTEDDLSDSFDTSDSDDDVYATYDSDGQLELNEHRDDELGISPFALFGGIRRKDLQNKIYGKDGLEHLKISRRVSKRVSMMERNREHLKMETMSIPGRNSTIIAEWEYRLNNVPNQKLHKKTFIGKFVNNYYYDIDRFCVHSEVYSWISEDREIELMRENEYRIRDVRQREAKEFNAKLSYSEGDFEWKKSRKTGEWLFVADPVPV